MCICYSEMFYIEIGLLDEWISISQLPKPFCFYLKTFKIFLECKLNTFTIHLMVSS